MTETTIDPQSTTAKARALLEADMNRRIDAVRVVAEAAAVATDYERLAVEARGAHEGAWRVAQSVGWSEKELKAAGVPAPAHDQQTPKPRRPRRTAPPTQGVEHQAHDTAPDEGARDLGGDR